MSGGDQNKVTDENLKVRVADGADGDAFVRFNRAMALETENKELPEAIVVSGVRAVFDEPARGFYVVAECAGEIIAALAKCRFLVDPECLCDPEFQETGYIPQALRVRARPRTKRRQSVRISTLCGKGQRRCPARIRIAGYVKIRLSNV